MAFYKITNVATGKLLSIAGDSVTTLKNNPNVIVYEDTGAAEQNWVIDSLTSGVAIRSVVDPDYGLNISTANNCNVYSLTGNGTIAAVSFIVVGSAYRIKTTSSGTELFLTANASGNVLWSTLSGDNYQLWNIAEVSLLTPAKHSYTKAYKNGITLHIIETHANNIQMVNLRQDSELSESPYYGVNGGYFTFDGVSEGCFNMALNNGEGVGPGISGTYNADFGFGVIGYYNSNVFYVPYCTNNTNLRNELGGNAVWAQGGGVLNLGDPNWTVYDMDYTEDPTGSSRGRTAIVANTTTNKVYLVVMQEDVAKSVAAFRTAIMSYFGITSSNTNYVGLLLDGGGSSSLKAKRYANVTYDVYQDNGRKLCQIIALKSNA